jgi:hypothetical protein
MYKKYGSCGPCSGYASNTNETCQWVVTFVTLDQEPQTWIDGKIPAKEIAPPVVIQKATILIVSLMNWAFNTGTKT